MDYEQSEIDYMNGSMMAWRLMLGECKRNLPRGEETAAALLTERTDAIIMLRELCKQYGDNDWPDTLHLGDIIEKHLLRHLGDKR